MSNAGKRCEVHYVGTLDDGTVFDSSRDRNKPLAFVCMTGQMIKGFDEAVVDMEVGETKTVRIAPDDAYGDYKEDGIQTAPRHAIPGTENLKVGDHVTLSGKDGHPWPCTVAEVTDEIISFDMNHPLAGKYLTFEIELLLAEETESGVSEHHH